MDGRIEREVQLVDFHVHLGGLQLMAPGESRRFWIPAELAFGTNATVLGSEAVEAGHL